MPKFRLEIFPEYKAQRSAMPEELRSQVDHMDEILEAMTSPPSEPRASRPTMRWRRCHARCPKATSFTLSPATRTPATG